MVKLTGLVTIDDSRFYDACDAYFLWDKLNTYVKNNANRGINIPETITETIACYALGFKLNRGSGGDARDEDDSIIEFKASSNLDRDLSSFSPSEKFDKLYFLSIDQTNHCCYIYDTLYDSVSLKNIQVNAGETVKDQQIKGRRPRFSIIKKILEPKKISPIIKVDLRKEKVIKL